MLLMALAVGKYRLAIGPVMAVWALLVVIVIHQYGDWFEFFLISAYQATVVNKAAEERGRPVYPKEKENRLDKEGSLEAKKG